MATTGQVIDELIVGAVTSAGAVIASGKARFYNTGGLVAAVVYSDAACTSPITQPITLDAGGRVVNPSQVWAKTVVRMIIKDSTDSTTLIDVDPLNVVRAEQVYITNANVNGGVETDLNSVIGNGSALLYQESVTATTRLISSWLREDHVSIADYGAVGDGATDATGAIVAAVAEVVALGGGNVYVPRGTFKYTGPITVASAGVNFIGAGRGVSILKNFSTTANGITYTPTDPSSYVQDLSLTTNAANSGIGLLIKGFVRLRNVYVTGYATGIASNFTSSNRRASIRDCLVEHATTAAYAIADPAGLSNCSATQSTGGDGTGFSITAATATLMGCHVLGNAANTGISIAANDVRAWGCLTDTCATGVSIVSGSRVAVGLHTDTNGSAGISVGAVANVATISNFAEYADTSTSSQQPLRRVNVASFTSAVVTFPAITPNFFVGVAVNEGSFVVDILGTYAVGAQALTINNSNTNVPEGGIVDFVITKTGANPLNLTWGAEYLGPSGAALVGAASVASATTMTVTFRRTGGAWRLFNRSSAVAV